MASLPSYVLAAPLSLVSSANLLRVQSMPSCVIDEDVEGQQSQARPLGDAACDRPPPRHRTIYHNPSAETGQPVLNPSNTSSFKSIPLQFREKDVVRDHVKCLAEVQVDDIHCPSPVYRCWHSIIEGHQTGQERSALGEAMLAVSDHLFISYVP